MNAMDMIASLKELAQDVLDGGIRPDDPRASDVGFMRRMRTLVGCCLALIFATPVTFVTFLAAGAVGPTIAVLVDVISAIGGIAYARRTGRVEVAAHWVIVGLFVCLLYLQTQLGGLQAPGQGWLFVPALLAGLT